ncbi:peroxidase 60 [Beta vulgaris subsp. vulgaris]|uniref:peroxidase 60 n=1 Tax=Beta vulgaris subsp. vulgaris TaxID=3555 RepID=UPI002036BB9D|nr:peroxidase 60 [Beta vulgaris subsp. vulgaris]
MARAKPSFSTTNALAIFLVCITIIGQAHGKLEIGFYTGKCNANDVEKIIFDIVSEAFINDFKIVASLLRMQFHDCFVRGCDASILLDGTTSEKTAGANGSVRDYELIDACKVVLEQKCPKLVSCADIIVIATRVAVFKAQGKWYDVETGREDGVVSSAQEAQANLPGPTISVQSAISLFQKRNLTAAEMVLLIGGGHSVGIIHCNFFLDRLYNFQGTKTADPTINATTLAFFKQRCPSEGSNNFVFADQTVGSEFLVDKGFYQAISQGKGVIQIDQQLQNNTSTGNIVSRLATTDDFASQFGGAMVSLGRVGVLTDSRGQIRTDCRRVNTPSAVTPPADTPPAVTPPAVTPPAETPPAVTPPAETPPVEAPPAITPPAETPPANVPAAQPPSSRKNLKNPKSNKP